jgi:hypothetical protein
MITKKPDDLLLFFKTANNNRKKSTDEESHSFYYVYGKDAVFIANYHFQTLSAIKYMKANYSLPVKNLTADSCITRRDIEECRDKGLPYLTIGDRDFGQ